jgi:cell division protein FtsQ
MRTATRKSRPRRQQRRKPVAGPRKNRRRGNTAPQSVVAPQAERKVRSSAGGKRLRRLGSRLGRLGLRLAITGGLVYGLLLGAEGVYDYATTASRFEVRGLVYEATPHVDDDHLRELLALDPGTNILSLDLHELGERVAGDPWVAKAVVTRQLPDTLEVAVEEHEPAALVLAGKFYLASTDGVVFKEAERNERDDLPVITGIARDLLATDRHQAEQEIRRGLEVLDAYRAKARPRLSEINLGTAGEVSLYTAETGTHLRLGRGEVEPKLARFDALRAAIGEKADELAIVHLDAASTPNRPDRIVARFFTEKTEAVLLAEAQLERAKAEEDTETKTAGRSAGQEVKNRAPKKRRIPRHH